MRVAEPAEGWRQGDKLGWGDRHCSCEELKLPPWEYRERSATILSKSQGKGAPAAASQALLCSFPALCQHNFATRMMIFVSPELIVLWDGVYHFHEAGAILGGRLGASRVPSLEMKDQGAARTFLAQEISISWPIPKKENFFFPWECPRPGWALLGAIWDSGKCPCPWQEWNEILKSLLKPFHSNSSWETSGHLVKSRTQEFSPSGH